MLLKAFNRSLVEDREKTYLTAAVAVSGTALTVAAVDTNAWADNDYVILGEIGSQTAELLQVNGAVSDGTSITIDKLGSGGCRYAHAVGEPLYRIDYNQVEFSNNSTDSTSGVSVLTTIEIQPDNEFTRYEDTANTTGYGFIRFKNATTSAFSSYSDGVNYAASGVSSSYDPRTLWRIRARVRVLLDEVRPTSKLSDDMIRDAINDKQRDIGHQRLWSFLETTRSFSTVANQFAYDIPSSVQKLYNVTLKSQPLIWMDHNLWKLSNWKTTGVSSQPVNFSIWNSQLLVFEPPSAAAAATTLGAAITSTTATTITVAATSSFTKSDYYRFIIDSEVIYATGKSSTTFTGCLRGQESTTAATHTNGTAVTERDIVYTAHVEPTDLFDTQDRTTVPEVDVIAYGAAIDLAPFVEKAELIPLIAPRYKEKLVQLESKYAIKQTSTFGVVKDSRLVMSNNLYSLNPGNFPRDISGS